MSVETGGVLAEPASFSFHLLAHSSLLLQGCSLRAVDALGGVGGLGGGMGSISYLLLVIYFLLL